MPLFEYRCPTCVKVVELLVRASERPVCPDCGKGDLEKLLSVAAAPASQAGSSPMGGDCPPGNAPCSPTCCRL